MKRSIITINENKCNGCGSCVPDCPEGALQIIDGKARLVGDLYCDGLGACLQTCPEGALTVEEREAEAYSERRVMENVTKQGANVIEAHLRHLNEHGETEYVREAADYLIEKNIRIPDYESPAHGGHQQGCPGQAARDMRDRRPDQSKTNIDYTPIASELRQWPVQLKLINPAAPYFNNAHLLLSADCAPFAYGNFHREFLKDRIVIMFCPKLDPYTEEYVDKLSAIFSMHDIQSVTVARMEVPCCGGVSVILKKAMEKSGRAVPIQERIISIDGEVRDASPLSSARAL